MRNNANTEKAATFRNLYNGKEITCEFPCTLPRQDFVMDFATSCGGHDFEIVEIGGFYGLVDSIYTTAGELDDIAARLERLEDEDADKLEAMAEVLDDLDEIERTWDDSYFVADTTLADYAEELCYECGYMPVDGLPDWISCHIDWEGVGRELSFDGYSETSGGVLYVAQ